MLQRNSIISFKTRKKNSFNWTDDGLLDTHMFVVDVQGNCQVILIQYIWESLDLSE